MADISKFNNGITTYNLKDEEARNVLSNIDDKPKKNSKNLVESGGVFDAIEEAGFVTWTEQNILGSKNLLPYPYADTTITRGGITFTDNGDGSVTLSGTSTGNGCFNLKNVNTFELKPGTYIFTSGCDSTVSSTTYFAQVTGVDGSNYQDYTGEGLTFTIDSDTLIGANIIVYSNGVTANNVTFKPMIRLASIADDTWAPYAKTNKQLTDEIGTISFDTELIEKNAAAIKDIVNVYGSKNLIPFPYLFGSRTINGITFTIEDDNSITINGTATAGTAFQLTASSSTTFLRNGNYIASFEGDTENIQLSIQRRKNGTDVYPLISIHDTEIEFEQDDAYDQLWVYIWITNGATFNNLNVKPMIRLASITDSTYVPFAKTNLKLTQDLHVFENQDVLDGTTASYTTEEKTKLSNISAGAEVNVQSNWNETNTSADSYIQNKPTLGTAAAKDVAASGNASTAQVVMGNDTRLTDSRNAKDVYAWAKASTKPTYTASEVGAIATTAKGSANGVAELDENGIVPASQLPSYVDDVLEYTNLSSFPATGEAGKIYVALDTNKTYRWSGTAYVEISPSLALGETSSTAYRGDRGKTAYNHAVESGKVSAAVASGLYKVAATAQGHIASLTAVQKSDITGLGIPAQDTTYNAVTSSANGLAISTDKAKFDGMANVTYGTCTTAAATVAKVGTVSNTNWALKTGSIVVLKFTYANTATNATLNVNSTGTKSIYFRGAAINNATILAGDVVEFVYNGTQYDVLSIDRQSSGGNLNIALDAKPAAGALTPLITGSYLNVDGSKRYAADVISMIGTDGTDGYNTGVSFGSKNGTTFVSAGESAKSLPSTLPAYNNENLYLTADGSVNIITNAANNGTTYSDPITFTQGNVTGLKTVTSEKFAGDTISDIVNVLGAKNFIPYPYDMGSISSNGLTFDVDDNGIIQVSGTKTNDNRVQHYPILDTEGKNGYLIDWFKEGETYTLSGCPSGGGNSKYQLRLILNYNKTSEGLTAETYYDNGNGVSFTITNEVKYARLMLDIYGSTGTTYSNLTFKPMLRPASIVDNTWVPYSMTNHELTESLTYFGTCDTVAATAEKVVKIADGQFRLRTGAVICVKFTYTNTAQNPTLNVNGSGAKPVWYGNAAVTTGSLGAAGEAGRNLTFMYNGEYWVWIGHGVDSNTTYSAMSVAELTTGTVTTARSVRSDYLKKGILALSNQYGTCDTAAATAAKVITTANTNFVLYTGARITIKFTNTNTAQNPTFNVNGTGAKSVMIAGALITTGNLSSAGTANRYMTYIYDGTQWVWQGWDWDNNNTYTPQTLGFGYGTCATAEATAAKVATLSGYTLVTNGIVSIKFTYAVPANATLNINSKGAKNIFYKGAKIVANIIKAGDLATFIYDGTQYQLISIDRETVSTASIGSASGWNAGATPTLGTAIPADDITEWDAGTAASASVSKGVLTITNGTAPSLTYTAKSIPNVTSVGTAPSLTVTSKTVVTGLS